MSTDVRKFLERYREASDRLDLDAVGESFADVFLSLDPNGVATVTREQLLAALPTRQRLFSRIGGIGADLSDVTQTKLDGLHTLVRTAWSLRFDPAHAAAAAFDLRSPAARRPTATRCPVDIRPRLHVGLPVKVDRSLPTPPLHQRRLAT